MPGLLILSLIQSFYPSLLWHFSNPFSHSIHSELSKMTIWFCLWVLLVWVPWKAYANIWLAVQGFTGENWKSWRRCVGLSLSIVMLLAWNAWSPSTGPVLHVVRPIDISVAANVVTGLALMILIMMHLSNNHQELGKHKVYNLQILEGMWQNQAFSQMVSYLSLLELSKKGNFMGGEAWFFICLGSWQCVYLRWCLRSVCLGNRTLNVRYLHYLQESSQQPTLRDAGLIPLK